MTKKEREFVKTVWQFYKRHGRCGLPWRRTHDPYNILVSEVMLQQTQVDRVIPKFKRFIRTFPNAKKLADAPLGDVLQVWQGLGYNRRAKLLHACAKEVRQAFPRTFEELQRLPGVGPYTAAAVMAFAYNEPVPLIETNIRTVYLNHFFKNKHDVTDADILRVVERTMDIKDPREWYAALMDYGAHLKQTFGNQNARSRHYTKQSKFEGSDRQIRGAIVRTLAAGACTKLRLEREVGCVADRIASQLTKLLAEGMVTTEGRRYKLP